MLWKDDVCYGRMMYAMEGCCVLWKDVVCYGRMLYVMKEN